MPIISPMLNKEVVFQPRLTPLLYGHPKYHVETLVNTKYPRNSHHLPTKQLCINNTELHDAKINKCNTIQIVTYLSFISSSNQMYRNTDENKKMEKRQLGDFI